MNSTCEICSKTFKTASYKQRHKKLVHAEVKIKFKCWLCEKRYDTPDGRETNFETVEITRKPHADATLDQRQIYISLQVIRTPLQHRRKQTVKMRPTGNNELEFPRTLEFMVSSVPKAFLFVDNFIGQQLHRYYQSNNLNSCYNINFNLFV